MMCGYATHHSMFHKMLFFSLQKESNFYIRLHKNTAGICATLGGGYHFLVKKIQFVGAACRKRLFLADGNSQEYFVIL